MQVNDMDGHGLSNKGVGGGSEDANDMVGGGTDDGGGGGGGFFSSRARILGECSTIHSLLALFFFFFLKWRLARTN